MGKHLHLLEDVKIELNLKYLIFGA